MTAAHTHTPFLGQSPRGLPLAALQLYHMISACSFKVVALSSNAALAFSPSSIAPKLNYRKLPQFAALGKVANLSIGLPSAVTSGMLLASGTCAVVKISHYQRGKQQANLKAA